MAKEDLFEEGKQPAAEKPAVNADKLKALRAAMDKIEKNYGKGSIMKLGDESVENIEVIPTGSIALNAALGVGGYPKGRVIEIYGPDRNHPVRQLLRSMRLPRHRKMVVLRHLSMRNMLSTVFMQKS